MIVLGDMENLCNEDKQCIVRIVGVHPHVVLSATRGKASPSLKVFFLPCFLAASKEVFSAMFAG